MITIFNLYQIKLIKYLASHTCVILQILLSNQLICFLFPVKCKHLTRSSKVWRSRNWIVFFWYCLLYKLGVINHLLRCLLTYYSILLVLL